MLKTLSLFPLNVILQGYRKRQTIRQLSALPDYLLADIGVERDAIATVVDGLMSAPAATGTTRPAGDHRITTVHSDSSLLLSRV